MDRETNFKDNNGNIKALTSWGSDLEWDIKTLCNKGNGFNTKNQEIGVNSNKEMSNNKAIWATVGYSSLDFIVLNL